MEVILREHVENLGRRGEVVKVADGYARNFLLPRKLAMPANPANKKIVERQGKIAEAKELAERSVAEAYAVRLTHADIVIARRVGENDTLYGSVTAADIADDLKAKGFEVDKRKIHLEEPLIRCFLNLDQVGNGYGGLDLGEIHPLGSGAVLLNIHVLNNS